MKPELLLEALHAAERLKDTVRHCDTSGGRRESVAEHCWRASLMAYWMKDAFPDADISRVVLMCVLHDLGEAFTGDIPVFVKTEADEQREAALLDAFVRSLPAPYADEMSALYREIREQTTTEARLFHAIDGLEALIQHNESALSTWLPGEYALNLTYAEDRVAFSEYLTSFRQTVREETLKKIDAGT